jgi:hypothetical protein
VSVALIIDSFRPALIISKYNHEKKRKKLLGTQNSSRIGSYVGKKTIKENSVVEARGKLSLTAKPRKN